MSSMVTGIVTGEEAVETYQDGNMAYDCEFLQAVDQFTFDGTTISGTDAGAYAYWLATGISTDVTQEDIENCIQLFCTENLSEQ